MNKRFWLLLLITTAVGIGSSGPASQAGSFFDNPSPSQAAAKQATAKTTQKKKHGLFWFLFERKRNDNVNVIYGDEPGYNAPSGDLDPEPLPSIGMGNLTYEPPLQVPVYDAGFMKLTAPTPQGEAIRQILTDKRSRILATVPNRKAILELYKSRNFAPVWITDGKLQNRAFSLMTAMAQAGKDGLNPKTYLPKGITSFETATSDASDLDENALLALDVSLTSKALTYAQHLSTGQFVPELLSQYYDINVQKLDPVFALQVLQYTPFPEAYLASLEPQHPSYKIMKEALAALEKNVTEELQSRFPTGPIVKPGQRDARIPQLRQRMIELGTIDPENAIVAEEDIELFDKGLSKAVKTFQLQNKLKATGLLDAKLVSTLNADPTLDQRNKLVINMERLRWLPKSLGNRYVFVNQPAFTASVMENNQQIWKTNVIIGKPLTQTPAFHDEYETVVFNPSWGMPQSILINEYLGKLRRNPGYFDKIGYKVTNANGQVVSSSNVNWFSVGPNSGIGVQQPPGKENALGELKFLFPNKHDVYMHDTPTRKLFAEHVRAYSHGCVRVENPREFAHVLLGWDREKIAADVEAGESFSVPVPIKTKVHITYFTAWPDENGTIRYFPDIYERDKTMLEAIDAEALGRSQLAQDANGGALISGNLAD